MLFPFCFFSFTHTSTTELYTLSLHDALPILRQENRLNPGGRGYSEPRSCNCPPAWATRSEEHTSELQSLTNLVCRLLLEKKKKTKPVRRYSASFTSLANSHPPVSKIHTPSAR